MVIFYGETWSIFADCLAELLQGGAGHSFEGEVIQEGFLEF